MDEVRTMRDLARIPQPIGPRIRIARENAGLTREGLAQQLGMSADSVRAWEADERKPRANRLVMLAGVLNVSMSWLLEGREDAYMESDDSGATAVKAELDKASALLAEAVEIVERAARKLEAQK